MKSLKYNFKIPAPADEVYLALTNPFTIELWSGFPAKMSTEEGSEFSLWDGDIEGKNLKFVQNELIQQQWYFDGETKDSIVTIQLKAKGESTLIEFSHENIPDSVFDEMKEGWKKYYWGEFKKFF